MYRSVDQSLLLRILSGIDEKHLKSKGPISREFITRLSANFSAIKDLFWSLYGEHSDCEKYLRQLVMALYNNYVPRPEELKIQDNHRETNHEWLLDRKWVGMSLYTENFAGDLKGFQKRLPYLNELGINLVHLMPLLESPEKEGDGGYAVSNYCKVNPRLGQISDIRTISKKFRDRDMLLILDLVLNHTSKDHKWAKKALAGNKKYQAYYYMYDDRTIPNQFEEHMPEIFPTNSPGNFTHLPKLNKWVMTVFHPYQ